MIDSNTRFVRLAAGSAWAMIKNAWERKVGVVLLNHNHASYSFSSKNVKVQFEEVIVPLLEKGVKFDFVAHSAGGSQLVSNLMGLVGYVRSESIGKLVFTDSIHSLRQISLNEGLSSGDKEVLLRKVVGGDAVYFRVRARSEATSIENIIS